jgi:predicted DNA-binding protein
VSKSIRIDEETHKKLRVHAAQTGSTVTEIIKAAVDEFIPDVRVVRSAKEITMPKKQEIELPEQITNKPFVKKAGDYKAEDYV